MTNPINAEVWRVRGAFTELFSDFEEAHKYAITIGAKVEDFYAQAVPSGEIDKLQEFKAGAKKVVVHSHIDASHANELYGERYGIDWVYEDNPSSIARKENNSLVDQGLETFKDLAERYGDFGQRGYVHVVAAEIDRLRGVLAEAHRQLKVALTDGTTTHTGIAEGILSAALAEGNGQEGGV